MNQHIDQFLTLSCAPKLLSLGVFGKREISKEISESMSAFISARKYFGVDKLKDTNVSCIIVGDGVLPRTGALFACLTKWNILSVDPLFKINSMDEINRLTLSKSKIENVPNEVINNFANKELIFICVHSHGILTNSLINKWNPKKTTIISIPCCFDDVQIGKIPTLQYEDNGILSPKNIVKIYEVEHGC